MLNWIMGLFTHSYKDVKTYHKDFVNIVLNRYCKDVTLNDNYYRFIKIDELNYILKDKIDISDFGKYESEFNDCDDSRDILLGKIKTLRKGWALGRCEIQGHALLCFIDTDSKLWLLDNNKSIREPKEKEILRIEF